MGKRSIKVSIHKLWWTDLLVVKVPYHKRVYKGKTKARRKKDRRLFAEGVAAGVSASLNCLEVATKARVEIEPGQVND